jgi:predicted transcriptional regulator
VTDRERAMLLSVRPQYAESILTGIKRAEIRRQRPGVDPGTPVIIYATMPVAAVVGTAKIEKVYEGSPTALWNDYRHLTGVTRQDFDTYLDGTATAYLLILRDAHRMSSPISLEEMRRSADFQPPRSYRYLDRTALRSLVNGHPSAPSLLGLLNRIPIQEELPES